MKDLFYFNVGLLWFGMVIGRLYPVNLWLRSNQRLSCKSIRSILPSSVHYPSSFYNYYWPDSYCSTMKKSKLIVCECDHETVESVGIDYRL